MTVPTNISRENILKAINDIDDNGIPNNATSSTYDVFFSGKRYPPKLVVSWANKYANGVELDRDDFKGGEKTEAFNLLEKEGFIILRKKSEPEFTWLDIYKELADKVKDYHRRQSDLVSIWNKCASKFNKPSLKDQDPKDNVIELTEIDPLTFMSLVNTYGLINRRTVFVELRKLLKLKSPIPEDFNGVPNSHSQSAWLFAYKFDRKQDDIETLWKVFTQASKFELDSEIWDLALNVKQCGAATMTQFLFCYFPEQYLPMDNIVLPALFPNEKPKIKSYDDYLDTVDRVNKKTNNQKFYEVSHNAWLSSQNGGQTYAKTKTIKRSSSVKNKILYGPPGTGKTYHTVNRALEILDPEYLDQHEGNRTALKERFDELKERGRIEFVTFHQSFSYEDFVEGLKASTNDNDQVCYDVEDGVFKSLCISAEAKVMKKEDAAIDIKGRRIWKMSLGNTNKNESDIYDECIDNNYILLGYGRKQDYSNCKTIDDIKEKLVEVGVDVDKKTYPAKVVNFFLLEMKIGDLVVVTDGNLKFRAIGEVTSDYIYQPRDDSTGYAQRRDVRWLRVYSPSLPHKDLMSKIFSQQTLYELHDNSIDLVKLADLLESKPNKSTVKDVLNGGIQIGQIFGRDYEVLANNNDILRLRKPNGSQIVLDWNMLNELATHVRNNVLSLDDIKQRKVFDKIESNLEKHIVNGYANILPNIVQYVTDEDNKSELNIHDTDLSEPNINNDARVLIIDEINRGNIAKIFGELITLIEPSKRAGAAEELTVRLPYSKREFSVPDNIHLIGTMNTADRSLAQLDIALRRRFEFEEMMPNIQLLRDRVELIDGVDVAEMLQAINSRIELLYDREHTIGHSYFMSLIESPDIHTLADIMDRQILPLLEEYFFEDWNKIRQVLGDISKEKTNNSNLAFIKRRFNDKEINALMGEDYEFDGELAFVRNETALDKAQAYIGIYNTEAYVN